MRTARLKMSGELRECYLYCEGDGSANNVALLQHGIQL